MHFFTSPILRPAELIHYSGAAIIYRSVLDGSTIDSVAIFGLLECAVKLVLGDRRKVKNDAVNINNKFVS